MAENFIDVKFKEMPDIQKSPLLQGDGEEQDDDKKRNDGGGTGDITINADPISAVVSGFFGTIDTVIREAGSTTRTIAQCVTEYKMCREEESTKRRAIEADLQAKLTAINAWMKDALDKNEKQFQQNMKHIQDHYDIMRTMIDKASEVLSIAVSSGKFELIQQAMDYNERVIQMYNQQTLSLIKETKIEHTSPMLPGTSAVGRIEERR